MIGSASDQVTTISAVTENDQVRFLFDDSLHHVLFSFDRVAKKCSLDKSDVLFLTLHLMKCIFFSVSDDFGRYGGSGGGFGKV